MSAIQHLSKISKLNEHQKGICISSNDNQIRLYSSSPSVYGETVVDGRIQRPGINLLPLTVIPTLSGVGDRIIELEVTLDLISIRFGRESVDIPQIAGRIEDVSRVDIEPQWLGVDLGRLRNIRYATNSKFDLDVLWMYNRSMVATDKSRLAVYKTVIGDNYNIGLSDYIVSFLPQETVIDLSIHNDTIFLGNGNSFIVTKNNTKQFPTAITRIVDIPFLHNNVTVSLNEFTKRINIAKNFVDDNNIGCILNMTKDKVEISYETYKGKNKLEVQVLNYDEDFKEERIKISTKYLYQALSNCISQNIMLGVLNIDDRFPLFYIYDYDIIHYMLPIVQGVK